MALKIIREKELKSWERKDGDHLRLTETKAKTDEGQDIIWYTLEVGTPAQDGDFHPKKSVSFRTRELRPLLEALHEIYYGTPPPGADVDLPLDEKKEVPF
jgi:hypothetical protein